MITPGNLVRHELIGLSIRIADSSNKELIGISGRVVDETRNTLTIETENGDKKVPKDVCTFSFLLPDGRRVRVEGSIIVARPEDRVKKKFRAW